LDELSSYGILIQILLTLFTIHNLANSINLDTVVKAELDV